MSNYDQGYHDGVYNLPPLTLYSSSPDYQEGYDNGRRIRKFAEYANDDVN